MHAKLYLFVIRSLLDKKYPKTPHILRTSIPLVDLFITKKVIAFLCQQVYIYMYGIFRGACTVYLN